MKSPALKQRIRTTSPTWQRLAVLWRWWVDELLGMLPRPIRAIVLTSEKHLYLEITDSELRTSWGTGKSSAAAGVFPLAQSRLTDEQKRSLSALVGKSHEIILSLPANKVLNKALTLPLVTEINLREVLGFEMDRQTPFTLEQVYYDHVVSKRDAKNGTLEVDLFVTPKTYIDSLLDQLRGLDIRPHHVSVQQPGADSALLDNLVPDEARQRRRDASRVVNLLLFLLALILLAAVIGQPMVEKSGTVDMLEAEVDVAMQKAQVVQRLGEEVEQLAMGSDFLIKKKKSTPLVIDILDELTRILPDDTWVNQLSIKNEELQFQGFADSAAALIPLIEASDTLHNPRFRASVTSSRTSDAERFHLSAETRASDSP